MVGVLSINAGAENNSDNLTQNYTVGTANVNLRGLGVASTLVLVNGRRQVLSSAQTDDGSSFVDLAGLAPMLAIERVEILKDGAAAIYGSEAVAGVVNFITRSDFEGLRVSDRVPHAHQRGVPGRPDRRCRVWRRLRRRRRRVPPGRQLPEPHQPAAGRGRLAAAVHQRFRQSGQLQRAVAGTNGGRSGLRAIRGTPAAAYRRRRDLPLRLRPANYDGAQRTAAAALGPGRLEPGRENIPLGRVRLREERHQPRGVAQLPGAEHARGAGVSPGQSLRRGRVLPGTAVRLRASAGDQLLRARNPEDRRRP